MPVIMLALFSIAITAGLLFHPQLPTELGLFAGCWFATAGGLLLLWHELNHKARTTELLLINYLLPISLGLCLAGLFDWLNMALFETSNNAAGFFSGSLLGALLGIWIGYRSLGRCSTTGAGEFAVWAVTVQILLALYIVGNQTANAVEPIPSYAPFLLHLCLTALFCTPPKAKELTPFALLMLRLCTSLASLLVLIGLFDNQWQPLLWQVYGLLCIWLCYRSLLNNGWQYAGSCKTTCLLALPVGLFACWSFEQLASAAGYADSTLPVLIGWGMAALITIPTVVYRLWQYDWQRLRERAAWLQGQRLPSVRALADTAKYAVVYATCGILCLLSYAPLFDQPAAQSLAWLGHLPGANRWLAGLVMKDYHPLSSAVRFDLQTFVQAADAAEVVLKLRPHPDRFSYTEATTEHEFAKNGHYRGMGLKTAWRSEGLFLTDVIPGSPAHKSGLQRGDRIAGVNGHTIDQTTKQAGRFLHGSGQELLTIERSNQLLEIRVTRGQIHDRKPEYRFITQQGRQIGYLRFDSFSDWLEPELKRFKNEAAKRDVQRLVIDLRANGGGKLRIAADMASWLLGTEHNGKPLMSYRYPLKYERRNTAITSSGSGNYPGAVKIAFITTSDTCSASESLINTVKVYRPVTLIGTRTCGKPWFMDTFQAGDETFSIISGEVLNARGESEPLQGMQPDTVLPEDLTVAAGSDNDPLLRAAVAAVVR